MTKGKKDLEMQTSMTQAPALPLPHNEETTLIQAEIDVNLVNAVKKEMSKKAVGGKKIKIREVVEWGLRAYLLASNPKEAAALGIRSESKRQ